MDEKDGVAVPMYCLVWYYRDYEKERNAIQKYVDTDDALKWGIVDSLGRTQKTTVINESGLYSLIFGSKMENAKKFKHWVTSAG